MKTKKVEDIRTTIRWNEREQIELEYLKKTFQIDNNSEAIKLAVEWVNSYLKNVAGMFYPPSFDVVLMKKLKTREQTRKVF